MFVSLLGSFNFIGSYWVFLTILYCTGQCLTVSFLLDCFLLNCVVSYWVVSDWAVTYWTVSIWLFFAGLFITGLLHTELFLISIFFSDSWPAPYVLYGHSIWTPLHNLSA